MLRSMLKQTVVTTQSRDFAAKKKKKSSPDSVSEYETAEDVAQPEVVF